MVEIVISVAAKVAEYLVGPIVHPIGYVWNYKSNFDKLDIELRKLEVRRTELQQLVVEAQGQGEDIFEHVQNWLNRVQNMVDEASQVVQEMGQANIRCPNPKKRYQHSKRAAKKAEAVAGLRLEENFTRVSKTSIPKEIWIPSHIGYEAFKSRESTLEEIQNALIDPNIDMIGVHGLGGIGKTTLARKVAEFAYNNNLFNVVAFAEVNEKPDIEKIQQEIAARLGLRFDKESPSEKAKKLQERLRKEEKVLLVLDNIWERLNLVDVGIPLGDDHKGCKLLLTSRDLNALTSTGSEHNIPLNFLNNEEAWNLFCTAAGDCVEQSELQHLAKKVANACGGLPIAIVTIAKALRKKKVFAWKKALKDLKSPSPSTLQGVAKETCFCIEISYNQLGEELKSIFLLCSAMQSTYEASVEDLVKYVLGLDEFRSMDRIQDVRDHVDELVQRLKDASLLLDTPNNESILMHDVVRDVGRIIASKNQHLVKVMDDNVRWNWYEEKVVKNSTRIFLHNVSKLPEELGCPDLQFLYMETTNETLKIPNNFFVGMSKLTVLHLVGFDLMPLPTSFGLLTNLLMLCINEGKVQDVALIGELTKLEVLSIYAYYIERFPESICKLSRLRLLDLRKASGSIKVSHPNSIASLTQLEEMYLGDKYIEWEVQEGSSTSVDEFKYLPQQLIGLEINIRDTDVLSKGLFSKKLERYNIIIGERLWDWWQQQKWKMMSRSLELNLGNSCRCLEDVPHQMESVKNVLSELDGRRGFRTLKLLRVFDSSCFQIVGHCSDSENSFPFLETLSLIKLINLEEIYNGQFRAKSLCNLRYINVKLCRKLKNIFSFSTIEDFPLQEIRVHRCDSMTEIFVVGGEENKIELNKLRFMFLTSLPQLTSFCSINNNEMMILEDECNNPTPLFNEKIGIPNLETLLLGEMNCELIWHNQLPAIPNCFQSLRELRVWNCHKLKCLFSSSKIAFPYLETITISDMNCLELIWSNQFADDSFGRLKSMNVRQCKVLKYLFPSSTVAFPNLESIAIMSMKDLERIWDNQIAHDSFGGLKSVEVRSCGKLKNLFSTSTVVFPNLESIKIFKMDNLEMIWPDQLVNNSFGSLKSMEVEECHKLEYIFSSSTVVFPNLESMVVSKMSALKTIWLNQLANDSFCNLKSMEVTSCMKLTSMFRFNTLEQFKKLELLRVNNCNSLNEIFDLHEVNVEESSHPPISSQLRKLDIENLRGMRHIWNKDPKGMLSFQELNQVCVSGCRSLENIFPASIAKTLCQLEKLDISRCGVKEIIVEEGAYLEAVTRFYFPRLSSLRLDKLSRLRYIYHGRHTAQWPILNKLIVCGCDNWSSYSGTNNGKFQPLFFVEKDYIFKLEELHLNPKSLPQGQEHLFSKVKYLKICSDEAKVFPFHILLRFPRLEKLELNSSSYKEIFSHEMIEEHAEWVAKIKCLELDDIYNLKHIWKQHPKLDLVLQELEILKVSNCGLTDLLPSSTSFRNLKILHVKHFICTLEYILTSSIAESLEQLTEMKIAQCSLLVEVVARDEGDTTERKIIFPKLKILDLDHSLRLTHFCTAENYTFEFPCLEILNVNKCCKMEIFCPGVVRTPKLNEAVTSLKRYIWEGDLNTMMQKTLKLRSFAGINFKSHSSINQREEYYFEDF